MTSFLKWNSIETIPKRVRADDVPVEVIERSKTDISRNVSNFWRVNGVCKFLVLLTFDENQSRNLQVLYFRYFFPTSLHNKSQFVFVCALEIYKF